MADAKKYAKKALGKKSSKEAVFDKFPKKKKSSTKVIKDVVQKSK